MDNSSPSTLHSDEDLEDDLRARYARSIRALRRVPIKLQEAYRTSWQKYYSWEPGYCEQTLRSLEKPSLPHPSVHIPEVEQTRDDAIQASSSVTFTVWSDDDNPPLSVPGRQVKLPSFPISTFAYPKYEACTPATHNILNTDDPNHLKFIPYADEHGFHPRLFSTLHDELAWQSDWYDVDFKVIALDAAWSAHNAGIELNEMDRHQVKYFPRVTADGGLLSDLRRRDLFNWGNVNPSDQLVALESAHRPTHSLWRSVSRMDSLFCSSINCVQALCTLHSGRKPPISHVRHSKENAEIFFQAKKPCGEKCFRVLSQESLDSDLITFNQDICDILKLFPDQPICKLASLLDVDCYDVFLHRGLLLPDRDVYTSFIPEDNYDFQAHPNDIVDFCSHEGSCDASYDCPCVQMGRRCTRRCRCRPQCPRRGGCKCPDGKCEVEEKKTKGQGDDGGEQQDSRCPCYLEGWECSPELCKGRAHKHQKNGPTKHACINMQIQRNKVPNLVVKAGSFGLGTFTKPTQSLPRHAFLGEYVAEMLPMISAAQGWERIDKTQRKVNRHRKLNYLFTLSSTRVVLDAATVGNPVRCLNDSLDQDKLNVSAEPTFVDGDERIYFYTTDKVQAGAELLLSYGKDYWDHHDVPSSDDAREAAREEGVDEMDDAGSVDG